jgi:hypothetical protein
MLIAEIFIGIVLGITAIAALLYGWRKLGAYPQPSSLSDAALIRRIEKEGKESAWIFRRYSRPEETQQTEPIKRGFTVKRQYVERLKDELVMRQMAAVVKAFHPDASSLSQRAVALRAEGHSSQMAQTMAQLEWGLQGLLTKHLKGEALHDQGDTTEMVLRAAEIVKAGMSESVAIYLALREWSDRAE